MALVGGLVPSVAARSNKSVSNSEETAHKTANETRRRACFIISGPSTSSPSSSTLSLLFELKSDQIDQPILV